MNVSDIRRMFIEEKKRGIPVGDTYELTGVSFIADEEAIFGEPNYDYIASELDWYRSGSLNVYDIKPHPPRIWTLVSDRDGIINSNYGHLIFSRDNHWQYDNVLKTLRCDPTSRQAVMIYTRPSMHSDAFENGRHDFVCTNTVQYLLRDGKLNAVVNMRSNDVVFGYRNDYAWQQHVLAVLADDLDVLPGTITWQVGSLHVYSRHWHLIPEE